MPSHTSANWPIAAAMLPFPDSQDEPAAVWRNQLDQVLREGFTEVDLTDNWVRIGDLDAARLDELRAVLGDLGLNPVAVSAIRRSVIDPEAGDANLEYSHRVLEAAGVVGSKVVSFGLHRPLTPGQREAFWFWTAPGPVDATDAATWGLAVARLRELGLHAAGLGLEMSLEMYEDTLLGSSESAVRLVRDIGLANVGLNPDLGNLYRLHRPVEDFLTAVERCLPHANYWHVKNYFRSEEAAGNVVSLPAPMAHGSANYRRAIQIAVEAGFDGPFCVEHYGGDGLTVSAENRDYIRRMLAVALKEPK
ncbi:sugar phosphate isomerase/epimerase [Tessaracoccus sp. MC1865]|uniref:sugar phosphate isomerase/epimerase family protein n=1 Tax=Tessaracoccus sp. MC1865 TaxID=2760310 RepID=UPI001602BD28|nr:sugar phosphate isomerase/epimerase family protein [Tessaracoccus sp. MC1865]MBB1483011.1 sugar phosphate isomerase/epimerase [Tessaracoccus sp. MC1865]QTO37554.1 sugar phosphate isomerase/epimerase [Tessaracoccus sp. MC1865]